MAVKSSIFSMPPTTSSAPSVRQFSEIQYKPTTREKIRKFFWDPDKRTVFYRTGQSWTFILLFYPLFIALVIGLYIGIMMLTVLAVKKYAKRRPISPQSEL